MAGESKPHPFSFSQFPISQIAQDWQSQSNLMAHRWAAAWTSPDPSVWLSLYTPTATYIDHAFQIRRAGTSILKRHFDIWRTSIPDFTMEVERSGSEEVLPGRRLRCSIRTINRGTLLKDLPSKRASGKSFSFRGVVDFIIREEDGLIEEVNEWYSYNFDNSKDVTEYHTLEDMGAREK
jgi:hypothetical protein